LKKKKKISTKTAKTSADVTVKDISFNEEENVSRPCPSPS